MANIILKIEGMSCRHCVMNVKKAVDAIRGVKSSDVSVGSANITYDETTADRKILVDSIQSAGYKVVD